MELLNSQQKYYKEFLQARKSTLTDEVSTKQLELIEIDDALKELDKPKLNGVSHMFDDDEIIILPNGYIPKWSYPNKIKFILEMKGKPLTARQIADTITEYLENDYWRSKTKKEKGKLYATISSTLTNNSKQGKDFVKSQNEIGENIYDIGKK